MDRNGNFNSVLQKIPSDHVFRIRPPLLFIVVILTYVSLLYTYNASLYSLRAELRKKSLYRKNIKYILLWTKEYVPLSALDEGNYVFVQGKCSFTNCIFTSNKDHFLNVTEFSAVVFGGWDLSLISTLTLPSIRSPKQKYVFVASESPHRFPVCDQVYNGFFNWTWTYRLDSDLFWRYVTIYDLGDNIIGPSLKMKWLHKFAPIDDELKIKLSKKSKAAAWFVSNCYTKSSREIFVRELQMHLKRYGWTVDIFGKCGTLTCPRTDEGTCYKKLERDYFFYLAFENSFSEDYVTEKLLSALNNYAVPIVYGAANYSRYNISSYLLVNSEDPFGSRGKIFTSAAGGACMDMPASSERYHNFEVTSGSFSTSVAQWFLPPGSYLNARMFGSKQLARRMNEIIRNSVMYHEFFRWRNHYKYTGSNYSDRYCKLCEMLNDEEKMSQTTVWKDFRTWWNGKYYKINAKQPC